jgi:hypothetical protein
MIGLESAANNDTGNAGQIQSTIDGSRSDFRERKCIHLSFEGRNRKLPLKAIGKTMPVPAIVNTYCQRQG